MKIFLSWSGDLSNKLASEINYFLELLFTKDFEIFFSPDFSKGIAWDLVLIENLKASEIGIICVTNNNQDSRFLNYEAGALSISFPTSKVIPIAFNIKSSDIPLPLGRFQAAEFSKLEFQKVVFTINSAYTTDNIKDHILIKNFDVHWSEFEQKIENVMSTLQGGTIKKTEPANEKIDEMVNLSRMMANKLDVISNVVFYDKAKIPDGTFPVHKTLLGKTQQFYSTAKRLNDKQLFYYAISMFQFLLQTIDEIDPASAGTSKSKLSSWIEEFKTILSKNGDDISFLDNLSQY